MADELLQNFTPMIESLTLIPSSGGRFEVTFGDSQIFSKIAVGRHAHPGEVVELFKAATGLQPKPRK